ASEGFRVLYMLQTVTRDVGVSIETTRSPIRVGGRRMRVSEGAPRIGQHTAAIRGEFGL
ncbi:MAG: CoA transferase, partial [Devosia sp.]